MKGYSFYSTPAWLPQLVCGLLLSTGLVVAHAAPQTTISVPDDLQSPGVADSVTLTGQNQPLMMQKLKVLKTYNLTDLQKQPQLKLDGNTLNFKEMLDSPTALSNIAQKLRALPKAVDVSEEDTTVDEVEQGYVVRSSFKYKIRSGQCRDETVKTKLKDAGIQCATRRKSADLLKSFALKDDPRFIKDTTQRAKITRDFQQKLTESQKAHDQYIAKLRSMLADPQQRVQFINKFGAAETDRLSKLSNDDLKEEVINASEVHIEQVLFVPKKDSLARTPQIQKMQISPATLQSSKLLSRSLNLKLPQLVGQNTNKDLGSFIYLTGFTLGKDYEWSRRVSVTINWCIFGCSETYYAEPFAGFNYGVGLRFPIRASLHEFYNAPNATVKIDYVPINGAAADYTAAGLPNDKLFSAKELVAQAGAQAGLRYKLPFVGSHTVSVSASKDFTAGLPAPFTNGQFTPPAPGTPGLPAFNKVFTDFDLLLGRANFSVIAAQVFPAVKVDLRSDSLKFSLVDNVLSTTKVITQTGQTHALGVGTDSEKTSRFTFGKPIYNLSFYVTPGVDARLTVDVEVWSHHWDWLVWFPQVQVQLPPGGIDFTCHAGTICNRNFAVKNSPRPVAHP